jgi:hypothetical protein
MENEVSVFKKIGPARCGTARRSSPSTVRGRSQAYSNYIQPHPPTVCQAGVFVLVTRTPTILVTISSPVERRNLMSPQTILSTEHEIKRAKVTHL